MHFSEEYIIHSQPRLVHRTPGRYIYKAEHCMVISLLYPDQTPPVEILTLIFDFEIGSVLQKFNFQLFRHYPSSYFLFKTTFRRLDSASILMLKKNLLSWSQSTELVPISSTTINPTGYINQLQHKPSTGVKTKTLSVFLGLYLYIFCLSVILKVDRLSYH
jgi:hypothetical protein